MRGKRLKRKVLEREMEDNRGAGRERDKEGKKMEAQKKTKRAGEAEREGGEVFLCGGWRVTGVPIEWPAMTVPLENAGYASGVALMEPERGCSCLPRRRDIVQLDKAA